jgi:hypothetical protein
MTSTFFMAGSVDASGAPLSNPDTAVATAA